MIENKRNSPENKEKIKFRQGNPKMSNEIKVAEEMRKVLRKKPKS